MKKVVKTTEGPAPQAPYSQAIIANGFVFVSGQGPIDPKTGKIVLGDIRNQTKLVLDNIAAILEAAGSSLDRAVKCSVFLKDIKDFAAMNEVYKTYFKENPPARTTVQAGDIFGGIGVEIDCIATLD
ncbi:MAG TPA: Rid family detoxifying hydrolase [Terriglobia bacterium]|jgi:2-iminobutanoate/2-iminopropanoate deaminase|nr:Rid family detoxifying hydrolase [Terriglobia bacterium]